MTDVTKTPRGKLTHAIRHEFVDAVVQQHREHGIDSDLFRSNVDMLQRLMHRVLSLCEQYVIIPKEEDV